MTALERQIKRVERDLRAVETLRRRSRTLVAALLELAKEFDAISELRGAIDKRRKVSAQQVIQAVCSICQVDVKALKGRGRTSEVALARQMAMALVLENDKDLSLSEVGCIFNRDHSTISYSVAQTKNYADTDKVFRTKLERVRARLAELNGEVREACEPAAGTSRA